MNKSHKPATFARRAGVFVLLALLMGAWLEASLPHHHTAFSDESHCAVCGVAAALHTSLPAPTLVPPALGTGIEEPVVEPPRYVEGSFTYKPSSRAPPCLI